MPESHNVWKPKGSPYWYGAFQLRGRRFNQSTRTENKREAIAFVKRWKAEEVRKLDRMGATYGRDMTVLDAMDRLVRDKTRENGASTIREVYADRLVDDLGPGTMLSEINDAVVADLVEDRRREFRWGKPEHGLVRDGTIVQSVIRPLSLLLHTARDTWKIPLPDMPKVNKLFRSVFARTRELSIREELRLLPALGDYRDITVFMLKTGFRVRSALLKRSDVHLEEGRIRVAVKGKRLLELPIKPAVAEILRRNIDNPTDYVFTYAKRTKAGIERRPITYSGYFAAFKAAAARVGIKDLVLHDLRRTAGARMYRATGNIGAVSKFLGHANVLITQRHYVHITPDDVGMAMDAMEAAYEKHVAEAMAGMTVH